MTSTRRKFLAQSGATAAVMTFGSAAPAVLNQAAQSKKDNGRILVVVEMAGGNDGLNTVIPYDNDAYKKARPKLAIASSDVLKIKNGYGFHSSLTGFANLLESGRLAVVQGVGYPNPNRSHFESMDIWHTCLRKDENRPDGWLGRYLEAHSTGDDPGAVHLGGDKQPFALMSRSVRVPSIRSLEEFRLKSSGQQFKTAIKQLTEARRDAGNDLLGFVQSSTSSAIDASERIESTGMNYSPSKSYPGSGLAQKLKTVARLIDSGMGTSVYYVRIDGFDTHSQQAAAHASLLKQVSDSVTAFMDDIAAHGHDDRVVCMCFSEFGRRVQENASSGTDHGTAGPVFLAGPSVKPGLIGKHPGMNSLKDGDLKHTVDFRQVYASVLTNWLKCDAEKIIGKQFNAVNAFNKA